MTKVSEQLFWHALEKNFGNYSQTAVYIEKEHGIPVTRGNVRTRALRQPERLDFIRSKAVDAAESTLLSCLRSENDKVRLDAAKFILTNLGKSKGYGIQPIASQTSDDSILEGMSDEELIEIIEVEAETLDQKQIDHTEDEGYINTG